MSIRLITAPFRLLYKIIGLVLGTLYIVIALVLTEVAGVYTYLQNTRPEALDRLRDSDSLLTDLTDILLSLDVIVVMILLIPATFVIIYIAQNTSGTQGYSGGE
jgi:ABC-type methionine transport system permease subunit